MPWGASGVQSMKQGTLFTKIIFAVLLVALLAYIILDG